MKDPRNPFLLRKSGLIDSASAYLDLFEPGMLDVLPKERWFDHVRMIRSAAFVAMVAMTAGLPQQVSAADVNGPAEIEEARKLVAQAEKIASTPDGYAEASRMYRRAAELFEVHSEASDAWAWAGRLAFYTGDDAAVRNFGKAGELALQYGDVENAASFFLDAAFAAVEHRQYTKANELVERAVKLAQSPYLSDRVKDRLMARVGGHTLGFRG